MLEKHETDGIRWYSFKTLDDLGFLKNWVTARNGNSLPKGLNNVVRFSQLIADGKEIYLPIQVHGDAIFERKAPDDPHVYADAVFLTKPDLPAGVLTADCLPIILADPSLRNAAVVHAGRKGVFNGLIGKTAALLTAAETVAAIGPGIRKCCYEVGEDVFKGGFGYFRKYYEDGKLDLVRAARDQLLEAGIKSKNIRDCGICTSCSVDEFYSHRKEKGLAGRFMTGIMIK